MSIVSPKQNLSSLGRWIRLGFALFLSFMAWDRESWILLAAALFTYYEALIGWCVLYQWMGKNSCPIDSKK